MAKDPKNWAVKHQDELKARIAADLRHLREMHGQTLEQISENLGHEKNWLSKIERTKSRIYLSDFLLIIGMLREIKPDHPAIGLLDYYTHKHLFTRTHVAISAAR